MYFIVSIIGILLLCCMPACAQQPELWFEPADIVAQGRLEFPALFEQPGAWANAAAQTKVFFTTANYFLRTPEPALRQTVAVLKARGIKLAIGVSALPVDKHICGDAVEGMVWPGEMRNLIKRLKALDIGVAYFSLDEPLSYGHFYHGRNACQLSIAETAQRLAQSIRVFRDAYPAAKIVDAEVPTGKPAAEWAQALEEWLDVYRAATGEDLDGLSMDLFWHHAWPDAARETAAILRRHHIRTGLYVHADAHPGMTAGQWVADVKTNVCAVRELGLVPDYEIVANWMIKPVLALPESDPTSLAAVLQWVAGVNWRGGTCH